MTDFRVQLDIFRGPLDLLLHLVRKHELEISTLQLGRVAEQFQQYLEVLQEIDINAVGDFLEVAGLLLEMKSQALLPRPEESVSEAEWSDPREQLVDRLLEYKQFKDAAWLLNERGLQWQQRYGRLANDLPPREIAPQDQPIQEIALWDLVSAVGRVLRQHRVPQQQEIVYDDTPIHVFVGQIHEQLRHSGQVMFSEMFRPGMHKSSIVGVFLAVLELIRHHAIVAVQEDVHGDIRLIRGDSFTANLDTTKIDTYGTPPSA
jgi:segregation and condensation protein A